MENALKLISTRRGSFYVAGLAALLAAVAILVYLNGYRDKLAAGSTPVTVPSRSNWAKMVQIAPCTSSSGSNSTCPSRLRT